MADGGGPDIDRWAAEVRDDATIAERARAASLRRQLDLEATLTGVLAELAAAGTRIELVLTGGRSLHGTIAAVAADHVRLRDDGGAVVLAARAHLAGVHAPGPRVAGEEPSGVGASSGGVATLASSLRDLAEEGAPARFLTVASTLSGRVVAAGDDLVVVQGTAATGTAYLPLAAVVAVWLER